MPALKLLRALHPLRDDLTMVCSELELGPQEFSWLSVTFLVNNSLVQDARLSLLPNLTKVPPSLRLQNIFQQHTFIFREKTYFLLLEHRVRPLHKVNSRIYDHKRVSNGRGQMNVSLFGELFKMLSFGNTLSCTILAFFFFQTHKGKKRKLMLLCFFNERNVLWLPTNPYHQ